MKLMDRLFGQMTKLKITAEDTGESFSAMYNPESFSETFSTKYAPVPTVNSEEEKQNFVKSDPQMLSLDLIIDGTGVTSDDPISLSLIRPKEDSVFTKVNAFLKMAWYPHPKTKKPNLLCLEWGDLKYYCHLSSVTITYTLFDKDGSPLRAKLAVKFFGDAIKNNEVYDKRFSGTLLSAPSPGGGAPTVPEPPVPPAGGGAVTNGIVISIS